MTDNTVSGKSVGFVVSIQGDAQAISELTHFADLTEFIAISALGEENFQIAT